tara:strand:+ start:133 stop:852 length:720 start_codon:yes stop_codon:yes gene_type:complete
MTMMEDFNQFNDPLIGGMQPPVTGGTGGTFSQNIPTAPIIQPTVDTSNLANLSNFTNDPTFLTPQSDYFNISPTAPSAPMEMIDERVRDRFSLFDDVIQQDFGFQPQGTPMGTAFKLPNIYGSNPFTYYTTPENQASRIPEPYEFGLAQVSATNPFAQEIFANPLAGGGYRMQPLGQENVQGMFGLPAGEFNMMPIPIGGGATYDAPRTFQDTGGSPITIPNYYSNYYNPFNPYSYWNR